MSSPDAIDTSLIPPQPPVEAPVQIPQIPETTVAPPPESLRPREVSKVRRQEEMALIFEAGIQKQINAGKRNEQTKQPLSRTEIICTQLKRWQEYNSDVYQQTKWADPPQNISSFNLHIEILGDTVTPTTNEAYPQITHIKGIEVSTSTTQTTDPATGNTREATVTNRQIVCVMSDGQERRIDAALLPTLLLTQHKDAVLEAFGPADKPSKARDIASRQIDRMLHPDTDTPSLSDAEITQATREMGMVTAESATAMIKKAGIKDKDLESALLGQLNDKNTLTAEELTDILTIVSPAQKHSDRLKELTLHIQAKKTAAANLEANHPVRLAIEQQIAEMESEQAMIKAENPGLEHWPKDPQGVRDLIDKVYTGEVPLTNPEAFDRALADNDAAGIITALIGAPDEKNPEKEALRKRLLETAGKLGIAAVIVIAITMLAAGEKH